MANNANFFSVADALAKLEVTGDTLSFLASDMSIWDVFGRKDSHLLRKQLFKIYGEDKVGRETIFIIHFLFSIIKNKNRVSEAMGSLPDELKSLPSMIAAKTFIDRRLVQYVTQETSSKFAVVHLPTTMPGLDLMVAALNCDSTIEAVRELLVPRATFGQMNLSASLQAVNKREQENFWNNVVKTSKNQDRMRGLANVELKFHENFYKNVENDKYNLVDMNMKEIEPKSSVMGYEMDEIVEWVSKVRNQMAQKTKGKRAASSASSTSALTPATSTI